MICRFNRKLILLSVFAALPLAIPGHVLAAEYLNSERNQQLDLPFSEAVAVGDLLILSGQLGTVPGTTRLAEGGITGQTRQVLENIRDVLKRNGSGMHKVVKCTVMLADIADWPAFNEVYVTFFPGPKPARSAFAASGLAFDGLVEVECWAER